MARLGVLHVITQSRPLGGAQRNTLAVAAGMDRGRFASHIACGPGGPLIAAARAADVPVTVIPTLDNPINPPADARALLDLVRLLRRQRFDIVHTHSTKAGLLGRLAARICRAPVVIHTIHAVPFHQNQGRLARVLLRALERRAARWCHRFIAVADRAAEDFARAGICPRKMVVTIRSGIALARFDAPVDRDAVRARLGIEPHHKVVGAVGHLLPAKGYPRLLQAAALVKAQVADLRLLIIGEGPLLARLRAQAAALGLRDTCLFLGRREDVPDLLRAMDVFAQASLWEGLPRTLQEAMYVGLPVVATAVNGIPEIVQDGVSGLLVAPDDPRALAGGMLRLLEDPALRQALGRRARARIGGEFALERTLRRTAQLYLSMAGGGLPSRASVNGAPAGACSRAPEVARPGAAV